MKRLALLTLILAGLASCSGGGGTSGITPPTPTATPGHTASPAPTSTPAIVYSVHLGYASSLGSSEIQASKRNAVTTAVATQPPIQVIGGTGAAVSPGSLYAQVSPMPSGSPVPTTDFSTDIGLSVQPTAVPQAAPADTVAWANILATDNLSKGGTASVAIGAPVSQTVTAPIYQYEGLIVSCRSDVPNSLVGITWNGTDWVLAADIASADFYITGQSPFCTGAYDETNPSGSQGTIHFPGGGAVFDDTNPFYELASSSWSNTTSTLWLGDTSCVPADPDPKTQIIFQTHGALIAKAYVWGKSCFGQSVQIAIEVSGHGGDGF